MPKDIRRLIFDFDEVTEALNGYATDQNVEMPPGKVVKLTLSDRDAQYTSRASEKHSAFIENYNVGKQNISAILTFFDKTADENQNHYFPTNTDFITASLIDYCLKHPDIKIPRRGEKNVAKTEFNICLDIHFDVTPEKQGPSFELEDLEE